MAEPIKRLKTEELITNLYENSITDKQLFKNIDNFLNRDSCLKINGLLLTSKDDIIEIFRSHKFFEFNWKHKLLGSDIYHFTLVKKVKKDNSFIKGDFLLFKYKPQKNIYIVITHENYRFFKNGLIPFLNKFYPLISRPYIDTAFMRLLLETYESKLISEKIWITRCVTKKAIGSDIHYTDLPFREVFDKVIENDEWIKSIDFNLVFQSSKDTINLKQPSMNHKFYKLFRDTRFQCNYNFSVFYERLIEGMANKVTESFELFDNRERIKEENFSLKPLAIIYDVGIFKDKNQNKHLIDALKKIKNSSVSVLHANPYLHVSYVDYNDGSSCDIWVLSENKISIIPQIRSTPAALERLCEHIFTGFREGVVKDFRSQ